VARVLHDRVRGAHLREGGLAVECLEHLRILGLELDHPEYHPALGRVKHERAVNGLGCAVVFGRHPVVFPQVRQRDAGPVRSLQNIRCVIIDNAYRPALRVMASHHPADLMRHACAPLLCHALSELCCTPRNDSDRAPRVRAGRTNPMNFNELGKARRRATDRSS